MGVEVALVVRTLTYLEYRVVATLVTFVWFEFGPLQMLEQEESVLSFRSI